MITIQCVTTFLMVAASQPREAVRGMAQQSKGLHPHRDGDQLETLIQTRYAPHALSRDNC